MKFTHLNEQGQARMVDVGSKPVTARAATAEGFIRIAPDVLKAITEGSLPKGDVLAVARIAGIQGAKRTADLIPLTHPLGLDHVEVTFVTEPEGIRIRATTRCQGRTGVEMEALTAVSLAALAIYDMVKAADRGMVIENIRLLAKSGGKSGDYVRNE